MEELDEFIISNYFSKNIRISDLFSDTTIDMTKYITYYDISDNDKIERISYELYGTPNYWDLLVLLNDKDPYFNIPFDFDTVYDASTNFLENYTNIIYSHAVLSDAERVNSLREEFLQNTSDINESNRRIKIIKPNMISDFIKLLKKEEYI